MGESSRCLQLGGVADAVALTPPLQEKIAGNRVKQTIKSPSPCAISGLLELLTRPWTLHILWALGRMVRCGLEH
jgi:hypothetical protein